MRVVSASHGGARPARRRGALPELGWRARIPARLKRSGPCSAPGDAPRCAGDARPRPWRGCGGHPGAEAASSIQPASRISGWPARRIQVGIGSARVAQPMRGRAPNRVPAAQSAPGLASAAAVSEAALGKAVLWGRKAWRKGRFGRRLAALEHEKRVPGAPVARSALARCITPLGRALSPASDLLRHHLVARAQMRGQENECDVVRRLGRHRRIRSIGELDRRLVIVEPIPIGGEQRGVGKSSVLHDGLSSWLLSVITDSKTILRPMPRRALHPALAILPWRGRPRLGQLAPNGRWTGPGRRSDGFSDGFARLQ